MSVFRLRVRDDAGGYYRAHRGHVIRELPHWDRPFGSFDEANELRRAMVNGAEFEVVEVED